jgi:hypothetical protein
MDKYDINNPFVMLKVPLPKSKTEVNNHCTLVMQSGHQGY